MKFLLKLLKYICCCVIGFFTLIFFIGAINDAPKTPGFLIIPFLLMLSGYSTYTSAKRKVLKGSGLLWWLYGTFIPFISWLDISKAEAPLEVAADTPQVSLKKETDEGLPYKEHMVKWEVWEMEHDKSEQIKRWSRAIKDCSLVRMLDERQCVAIVGGNRGGEYTTSLSMCSCPDFAKRHKPCKHMYFLAHHLGVFNPYSQ